ncbi:hypothetical protein J6590_047184 [Homalodisca vitripennis]|nr:hypothetical protein J6590_047184 [Homalodisca vitripennis]
MPRLHYTRKCITSCNSTPKLLCSVYNGYRKINRIKLRRAWLLLGWVTAERSCPCKLPACPAIGSGFRSHL